MVYCTINKHGKEDRTQYRALRYPTSYWNRMRDVTIEYNLLLSIRQKNL